MSGPVWKSETLLFASDGTRRAAVRLHRRHTEEVNDARRALFRQRRQAERRQGRDWLTIIFFARTLVVVVCMETCRSYVRTDVRTECAWSGAAPAEGCGRVRGTAGAGTDARGGPRDARAMRGVFLFVNLRVSSVRYSSDRRVRRVRGRMPAGEARNPGKEGGVPLRVERREGARGVDLNGRIMRRRTAMRTR